MKRFDAIIIGTGQAGPPLAKRLAKAGMKVAVIERQYFGGTCVNTGCTPTKTMIASAYAAHLSRRSGEYGLTQSGDLRVDIRRVKARADSVLGAFRSVVEKRLRETENCTVIRSHARFEGPSTVRVDSEVLTAPRIFINVGARASVPPLAGVDEVPYLTNSSLLALDRLPEHLIIIGGSYIGLEFAQMYRRFGSQVTIVEKGARLISREDPDISQAIREILTREGIRVRTGAECIRIAKHDQGVEVGLNCAEGDPKIIGSDVLLAVGRKPNTDDLGLDRAGVSVDSRGFIEVDDQLATRAPGIWALGDCNGRGAFTHTAYNDFEIVAANLLDGERRRVSDRIPAYGLYIDPPLGRVGMNEKEARASGRPLGVGKYLMSDVSRAIEKGETQGLMKIIVDREKKTILGAAVLGVGGDEAIHGILNAMGAGTSYEALMRTMPIHPTVSELIPTLLGEIRPID